MTGALPADSLALLQSYSGLGSWEVLSHVENIREEALKIAPYPCIQEWRFLELALLQHFAYPAVIQKLSNRNSEQSDKVVPKLLDLGCCVGQNLRQLRHDGIDATQLIGLELERPFINIGFELFRDRERQPALFTCDNLFNLSASSKALLEGQCDIIAAMSFFHLFNLDQQLEAAKSCLALLRDENGAMVIGRQVGSLIPRHYGNLMDSRRQMYLHSPETFKQLWNRAGRTAGITWEIAVEVDKMRDPSPLLEDHMRWLSFSVTRTGRNLQAKL